MRLVKAFKIFYGRRLVVKPTEFSERDRTADKRRNFIKELIKDIEIQRLVTLEKRRKKRLKQKVEASKEEFKEYVEKQLEKPITETLANEEIQMIKNYRESRKQVPQFEKTKAVEPVVANRATIDDTLLIPVAPDGNKYKKQIVDKMVTSPQLGKYHLAILDIDLFPEAYVEMTEDNFDESLSQATQILLPSLMDYFEQTKKSSRLYILRIKFLNSWDGEDYSPQGISYFRVDLTDAGKLASLFQQTFYMLFGPRDKYDRTTKGRLRARYLEGDKRIFITGATLEATEIK